MKKDIENRADIQLLVDTFYEKVKADDTIGFIFNDITHVNWEKHLPVMYNFWENVLFYTGAYQGNPMSVHQHIHRVIPLTRVHFDRWYALFSETVDGLFEGNTAMLAKQRAMSIATVMQIHLMENSGH